MVPEKYSEFEAKENLPFFKNLSSLTSIVAQEKRKKIKKRYQAKNDFFICKQTRYYNSFYAGVGKKEIRRNSN
jgi:hypothetical protein